MPEHRYDGPKDDEVKEAIAQWIREYLSTHEDKQVELAHRLGVSEGTITNIKKGKHKPGFTMLVRLQFALGTAVEAMHRHLRRNDYPPIRTKGGGRKQAAEPEIKPLARRS